MPVKKSIGIKDLNWGAGESAFQTPTVSQSKTGFWNKLAKACLFIILGATPVFFLPWTYYPVDVNKQILVALLAFIGVVAYLIDSLENKKILYPRSLVSLGVLLLTIVLIASSVFATARESSLFGNFIQADTLFVFVIGALLFFLSSVVLKREDLKFIARVFFIGFSAAILFSLLQIFGAFILPLDFTRQINFNTIGSMLNLGIFAAFGLAVIISILFDLSLNKIQTIVLSVLGAIALFLLIILNYTAIWYVLALFAIFLAARKFLAESRLNSGLVVIIGVFIFLGLVSQFLPTIVRLPAELRPNLTSSWVVAKSSVQSGNFLLGTGPASYANSYSAYHSAEINKTNFWSMRFNQGFNLPLTMLATTGLLGCLTLLLLLLAFTRKYSQLFLRQEVFVIASGAMFLIVAWFFSPNFFTEVIFIFFGLGLAESLTGDLRERSTVSQSKARTFALFISIIIIFALGLAGSFFVGKKYAAAIHYGRCLMAYNQAGDTTGALSECNQAISLDQKSDAYYRTMSQLLLLDAEKLSADAGRAGQDATALRAKVQNEIALAIEAGRQATVLSPADRDNWSNLGSIYEKLVAIADTSDSFAEENYSKAMALDPNNPQEPLNIARTYISSADILGADKSDLKKSKLEKAKSYIDKSIALKPDYAAANYLRAVIALREGKTADAIKSLETAKKSAIEDAGLAFQLGTLYYNTDKLNEARGEFERAVAIDANYSNARYFLGLIYDKLGDKPAAIAQFEKISALNPDNQEVKDILKNLRAGKPAIATAAPATKLEVPVPEKK